MEQVISEQLAGARQVETFSGLSLIPHWNQPGTSGDTGGISGLTHGTYNWVLGNPASLTIKPVKRPAGKPWDNYYFYNVPIPPTAPTHTDAVYFSYAMEVTLPAQGDINACTAWENELEVCEAGLAYNMAWQCLLHTQAPAWRLFDLVNQAWIVVKSIPPPSPKSGVKTSFLSKFSLDRVKKMVTHESLTIDGIEYPVNVTLPAKMKWSAGTFYTHNAFQLDSDGKGTPYTVSLSNITMRRL